MPSDNLPHSWPSKPLTSPSQQAGGSNIYHHCENVHQSSFELSDPYLWSDMPISDPSTSFASRDPLFTTHGSSPDSIFADSALLGWDDAIGNFPQPLIPPVMETFPDTALETVGQFPTAAPDATLAYGNAGNVSGFPSPRYAGCVSYTSSNGSSSPPGNMCPKESTRRVDKRQMNTMAARRYRKRRLDRMNELEAELEIAKREREEWRVKASILEGEASALKKLLESRKETKET
ncbi:hypothetical protein P170DRAFT_435586 [Aspergillus steynii IBT 23096]|uniref:BZIP domain-containing protein n=1 Tax=Aspergillus steynii IBT 23096 TaxID=1392250 RepID=A0A2I2GC00_9EURO|nr:uncharacterized protein P170DRAFT_435586 [Aspergillus steynii IBT 23096]PLB50396.1 hypothetical protein P170DRAFT_435586 [Aspergillus steynii IBT 23096]